MKKYILNYWINTNSGDNNFHWSIFDSIDKLNESIKKIKDWNENRKKYFTNIKEPIFKFVEFEINE